MKRNRLNPQIPINNLETITITGITEGIIPSYGSAVLDVFDTPVKFYVMPDELKVPDDGILGGDYFYQEQVTISYSHKAIVTISRPVTPIPFLNPQKFLDTNRNFEKDLPFKTHVLTLKARTRHVIPIEVANNDCDEGLIITSY